MVRGIAVLGVFVVLALANRMATGQEAPGSHDHGTHEPRVVHDEHDLTHAMESEEDSAVRPRQSFLIWFIGSLGWKYTLLLPLAALVSFVLTAALVMAGKGRTTGAALVFIVPLPLVIGLFGTLEGAVSSFMVIAMSDTAPKPAMIAEGISTSLVTPMVGMLLMAPSYLLAVVGLTVRALKGDPKSSPPVYPSPPSSPSPPR